MPYPFQIFINIKLILVNQFPFPTYYKIGGTQFPQVNYKINKWSSDEGGLRIRSCPRDITYPLVMYPTGNLETLPIL